MSRLDAPNWLQTPPLAGWAKLQAQWVDWLKRRALRLLHQTAAGQEFLLRVYLVAEQVTELSLQQQLLPNPPEWLQQPMAGHLRDEQAHARAFAIALGKPVRPLQTDWLSRYKIGQWRRLALSWQHRFGSGLIVPVYAIGYCAEQMAERVLQRHLAVLPAEHSWLPLLQRVCADEASHIDLCQQILQRAVTESEQQLVAQLLQKVRQIERSWGVTGALILCFIGLWYWLAAVLWSRD